jgi:hypothetical protein
LAGRILGKQTSGKHALLVHHQAALSGMDRFS